MPLRGRVGRHAKTGGKHCQNWPDDQQLVLSLLNQIAVPQGGTGGDLSGRIVNGMASDALNRAIARFENLHFPRQGSGFVDPGGAMLRKMEQLAVAISTAPAPPPKAPPAPPPTIALPSLNIPIAVKLALEALKVKVPTKLVGLTLAVRDAADAVYKVSSRAESSLNYDDIYLSDGVGGDGRPFTVAVEYDGRWVVVLNVGSSTFNAPLSDRSTLIHELAHAWQSQHYPNFPQQFMINCAASMAAAAAFNAAQKARRSTVGRFIDSIAPIPLIGTTVDVLGDRNQTGTADAYAYVPGAAFGSYGGEQIAQQVQNGVASIVNHIRSVRPNQHDAENVRSLSTVRFGYA